MERRLWDDTTNAVEPLSRLSGKRLFEDEEEDANNEDENDTKLLHQETVRSLQFLQKPAQPLLPDEQDRKRFIGCLAAVLASLYDYDCVEDDDRD